MYSVSNVLELPADIGTVTQATPTTGGWQLTYTFKTSTQTDTSFRLTGGNNYSAQTTPMPEIGAALKKITWLYNGTEGDPAYFTQVIKPDMNPTAVTRVSPSPKDAPKVNVGKEYTYSFSVNETSGVGTNGWDCAQVNSAVNYGTTITIPVPEGFKLDVAATKAKNIAANSDATVAAQFKDDKTTITQDASTGVITISVPKGYGSQHWRSTEPYYLVGSFDREAPDESTTITASAGATISQQQQEPDGTLKTVTVTTDPWTETLRAKNDAFCNDGTASCLDLSIAGNSKSNIFLEPSSEANSTTLKYLNFFGVKNNSANDLEEPEMEIDVPSGFNATAISTPKDDVKLKGLTSYRYDITLLDGTKMTGTVAAGETITQSKDSPMRKILLYPNLLAAGMGTDAAQATSYLPSNNKDWTGTGTLFALLGNLSTTYDDGTAVKVGDTFETGWSVLSKTEHMQKEGTTVFLKTSMKNTQTVVDEGDLFAQLSTYADQSSTLPGAQDAARLGVSRSLDNYTTQYIYEPVFYYVLPAGFTYNNKALTYPTSVQPTITMASTDDGKQVVKIDYTGTGYSFNTLSGATDLVGINIDADALLGTNYQWNVYLYSPTTKFTRPHVTLSDTSYVMGNTDMDNIYALGSGNFTVSASQSIVSKNTARGNQSTAFMQQDTTDYLKATNGYSSAEDMEFGVSLFNSNTAEMKNVQEFFNVPQKDDNNGFSVQLTGPVTAELLPGLSTQPEYTVKYSTKAVTLGNTAPSTADFVAADQVSDWSTIKSLVIEVPSIPKGSAAGRFIVHAKDPTLAADCGKSVSPETGFYHDTSVPLIYKPNSKEASKLTVTGKATVTARLHWKDASGADQYKTLDDLTKQYEINVAKLEKSNYPSSISAMSSADVALLPKGYKLADDPLTLIADTTATYPGGSANAYKVDWSTVVRYNYNGAIVQYELEPEIISTMPVTGWGGFWNVRTLLALTVTLGGLALAWGAYDLIRRARRSSFCWWGYETHIWL